MSKKKTKTRLKATDALLIGGPAVRDIYADADRKAARILELAALERRRASAEKVSAPHLFAERTAAAQAQVQEARTVLLTYLREVDGLCTLAELPTHKVAPLALTELIAEALVGAAPLAQGSGMRYWAIGDA